ncbi:MAG: hypothetical protein VZR04_06125, partial [Succiniclasticum sp.]|nr:hypothetical protein [Succiniclasticum sp.]
MPKAPLKDLFLFLQFAYNDPQFLEGRQPKPPLLESQKQRLFLLGITEKYRKQDMSSFVISSQCNNCMAYQAK